MTTELEGVNRLLASIGEPAVVAFDSPLNPDAVRARAALAEASRTIQARGWWFNRETEYSIAPGSDGRVLLPENTLSASFARINDSDELAPIARGRSVYDPLNKTYIFEDAVIVNTLILQLPFEELPEIVKAYVLCKAARLFATGALVANAPSLYTDMDEARLMAEVVAEETRQWGGNAYWEPDSYSINLDRSPRNTTS